MAGNKGTSAPGTYWVSLVLVLALAAAAAWSAARFAMLADETAALASGGVDEDGGGGTTSGGDGTGGGGGTTSGGDGTGGGGGTTSGEGGTGSRGGEHDDDVAPDLLLLGLGGRLTWEPRTLSVEPGAILTLRNDTPGTTCLSDWKPAVDLATGGWAMAPGETSSVQLPSQDAELSLSCSNIEAGPSAVVVVGSGSPGGRVEELDLTLVDGVLGLNVESPDFTYPYETILRIRNLSEEECILSAGVDALPERLEGDEVLSPNDSVTLQLPAETVNLKMYCAPEDFNLDQLEPFFVRTGPLQ